MWKETLFWFSQPGLNLTSYDTNFFWAAVVSTIIGLILKILVKISKHPVVKKLINKFSNPFLTMGLVGLLWFGVRYENTPMLANRYWAGLIGLIFLMWLAYVFKYWFRKYGIEKREYDKQELNSRYIPGPKR